MKKLILFISFIFCFVFCFSQPVIQRAGPANTVSDNRLMAGRNFFLPRYADTTAANLDLGIDSCGALIYTYLGNTVWKRNCSPKKWEAVGTGSGSGCTDCYDSMTQPDDSTVLFHKFDGSTPDTLVVNFSGATYTEGYGINISGSNVISGDTLQLASWPRLYKVRDSMIAVGVPINKLTVAAATNIIDNGNFQQEWQWNSVTTGNGLYITSTSLSSGKLLDIRVNSTAATTNLQRAVEISMAGVNANSSQTTYALNIGNSHTGTSSTNIGSNNQAVNGTTNIAGRFVALGGTNNYGIIVPASSGIVGFGTETPDSTLTVIGGVRINNGAAVSGHVWTSTGTDGRGTWQAPSAGSGTVTSVATGYGLSGGTITTSGTLLADTLQVASWLRLYKVRDSMLSVNPTIYRGDGTLTGNRTVTNAGFNTTWSGTGYFNVAGAGVNSLKLGESALSNQDSTVSIGYMAGNGATKNRSTFVGHNSGVSTTSDVASYFGHYSGFNSTGNNKTALGERAGAFTNSTNQTHVGVAAGLYSYTNAQASFFGVGTGQNQTGFAPTGIGYQSLNGANGEDLTAIGNASGLSYVGNDATLLGVFAGYQATGDSNVYIGSGTGQSASGSYNTFVGQENGGSNSGSYVTSLGAFANPINTKSKVTLLGYKAMAFGSNDNQILLTTEDTTSLNFLYANGNKQWGFNKTNPEFTVDIKGKLGIDTASLKVITDSATYYPLWINRTTGEVVQSTFHYSGGGGGVTTMAAIGSSPNANGATISGSTLNLEPASASFGGVVTTGTQTFAGSKTFSSDPTFSAITAGSVLFAGTGGLVSQDNSSLFFDNTNNRLGLGTTSPDYILELESASNIALTSNVRNTGAGAAVQAGYRSDNGTSFATHGTLGTAYTTYGALVANSGYMYTNSAVGYVLMTDNAAGVIKFAAGGNGEDMRINAAGELLVGSTTDNGAFTVQNTGALYNSGNGSFGTTTTSDRLNVAGDILLTTAGNKLKITTGSNASIGTGTFSSGTATISTTAVTANSLIFVQHTNCSNCGSTYIGTITAATSFVVNSTNVLDGSTFNWWIVN